MYFLCSRVLSDREEKTENLHAVLAATGANVIVVVNDAGHSLSTQSPAPLRDCVVGSFTCDN